MTKKYTSGELFGAAIPANLGDIFSNKKKGNKKKKKKNTYSCPYCKDDPTKRNYCLMCD